MILNPARLPILETERLRLEPITAADCEAMTPVFGDPAVMAWWDVPEIADAAVVAEIIERQVEDMRTGHAIYWAMRTIDGGRFLGVCDLSEIERRHRRAEVGFILGAAGWGQGYALEAMRTVVAYAAVSGIRKLSARTHLGNRRSDSLLQKLGFEQEGLLRGHIEKDGQRRDCRLFGLLL